MNSGQNLITLKHKDSSNRNLIVKFHLTTGVVLIQGSRHNEWRHTFYGQFKSRVGELCSVNTVPGGIQDHCDEDITAEKQRYHDDNWDAVDGGDDDGSVVISGVEEEVEVTNQNDDLGDIAVHEDTRVQACPAYDPIQRLEEAYVKLIDTYNENMSSLRTEIVEIKHEVRKIPNKVYDCVKKDIQANTQALRELTAKLHECDDHKNQISYLAVQLRNKNTELWSLRRELALLRSPPKQQVSHREAPISNAQGIPVEPASQGAPNMQTKFQNAKVAFTKICPIPKWILKLRISINALINSAKKMDSYMFNTVPCRRQITPCMTIN